MNINQTDLNAFKNPVELMMSAQGNLYAWPPSPSPLSSRVFQNLSSSQADIDPNPLNLELIPLESDLDDAVETSPDR